MNDHRANSEHERQSPELSGKAPEYRILDDAEVMLTIFAAKLPNQDEVGNDDLGGG